MDQKGHKMDQKMAEIYEKWISEPKIPIFSAISFSRSLGTPIPPKQKLVCETKLAALRDTICIWKNPDTFEIIQKIGSHLEKSGQF